MPRRLLDQVSFDGKMYGVPSNVHRINSIFYNPKVFEKYGLTQPTSVADFRDMARKLKGTGVSLLAVGSKEPWTLALVTFESLLVAREGPTFYPITCAAAQGRRPASGALDACWRSGNTSTPTTPSATDAGHRVARAARRP